AVERPDVEVLLLAPLAEVPVERESDRRELLGVAAPRHRRPVERQRADVALLRAALDRDQRPERRVRDGRLRALALAVEDVERAEERARRLVAAARLPEEREDARVAAVRAALERAEGPERRVRDL